MSDRVFPAVAPRRRPRLLIVAACAVAVTATTLVAASGASARSDDRPDPVHPRLAAHLEDAADPEALAVSVSLPDDESWPEATEGVPYRVRISVSLFGPYSDVEAERDGDGNRDETVIDADASTVVDGTGETTAQLEVPELADGVYSYTAEIDRDGQRDEDNPDAEHSFKKRFEDAATRFFEPGLTFEVRDGVARAVDPDETPEPSPSPAPTPSPTESPEPTASPTESPDPDPTPDPSESAPGLPELPDTPDAFAEPESFDATVPAGDSAALEEALAALEPGDALLVEPGTYTGEFAITARGTESEPITVWAPGAVLDAGSISGDYGLHLDGAAWLQLSGLAVTNAQKGVIADEVSDSVLQGLRVSHIGDEGIHLRTNSVRNLVVGSAVSDTGNRNEKFGEGLYVGSSKNNWDSLTDGEPDRSDDNVLRGNTISDTTSESVDIKEGTRGGVLEDNTFDGASITAADSWVDLKGNEWTIRGNEGSNTPLDGFQTHELIDGEGQNNLFEDNHADLTGAPSDGYAIGLHPVRPNTIRESNTVTGGALTNGEVTD